MDKRYAFWRLTTGIVAVLMFGATTVAQAQSDYPSKPIRVVLGFPPGQNLDIFARALASHMSPLLGQSVVVDNRPGAGGNIAAEAVKNAAPDGYTLLCGAATIVISPALYKNLPYDPVKDFAPVAPFFAAPVYLIVNRDFPANTVQELIAYAKANPGKVSYGSGGKGTTSHLAMELLKNVAGIDMLHVPYKGSAPAMVDLISGRVQVMFDGGGPAFTQLQAGRIKMLGVATPERLAQRPEIPTIAEQGVRGYSAVSWGGILAPAGTPSAIVEKLNEAINTAMRKPEMLQALNKSGTQPFSGTSKRFAEVISTDLKKWGQAARAAGIEPE